MGTGADWPVGAVAHQIAIAIGPRLCAVFGVGVLYFQQVDPFDAVFSMYADGIWSTPVTADAGAGTFDSPVVYNEKIFVFNQSLFHIYRSLDSGASWFEIPSVGGDINYGAFDLKLDSEGRLWASFSPPDTHLIYWSEDNGDSWNGVGAGLGSGNRSGHIAIHPTDPNKIVVMQANNLDNDYRVWVSDDRGATWTQKDNIVASSDEIINALKDPNFTITANGRIILWMHLQPNLEMRISDDYGDSWITTYQSADSHVEVSGSGDTPGYGAKLITSGIRGPVQFAIKYFVHYGGASQQEYILRTIDEGLTWEEIAFPTVGTNPMAVAYDESNDVLYTGSQTDDLIYVMRGASKISASDPEWQNIGAPVAFTGVAYHGDVFLVQQG